MGNAVSLITPALPNYSCTLVIINCKYKSSFSFISVELFTEKFTSKYTGRATPVKCDCYVTAGLRLASQKWCEHTDGRKTERITEVYYHIYIYADNVKILNWSS